MNQTRKTGVALFSLIILIVIGGCSGKKETTTTKRQFSPITYLQKADRKAIASNKHQAANQYRNVPTLQYEDQSSYVALVPKNLKIANQQGIYFILARVVQATPITVSMLQPRTQVTMRVGAVLSGKGIKPKSKINVVYSGGYMTFTQFSQYFAAERKPSGLAPSDMVLTQRTDQFMPSIGDTIVIGVRRLPYKNGSQEYQAAIHQARLTSAYVVAQTDTLQWDVNLAKRTMRSRNPQMRQQSDINPGYFKDLKGIQREISHKLHLKIIS
ncbi:hypothetical protein FHQ08_12120 [Lactobacillus sp. CC-MHH1034]|uniref:hypothetical protein n=1 Tax=Agrilactobacillus fermenti TaxID=2586909 RepID=UPI001E3EF630|nr:hypothetical protein [Agrilactobacillus fermenti]MCD2257432.1 hypothetical protein [Agrilactobacillus fermenti]